MMFNNRLIIDRRDGYGDTFNDFEIETLRPWLEGKSRFTESG